MLAPYDDFFFHQEPSEHLCPQVGPILGVVSAYLLQHVDDMVVKVVCGARCLWVSNGPQRERTCPSIRRDTRVVWVMSLIDVGELLIIRESQ
jgi:hypothetical protein